MAFSNDNMIVKDADDRIKFQISCYRLFVVYAIGNCSITSAVIRKAKQFGFFIALLTPGFKLYSVIGAEKDGNTLLKRKQYNYDSLKIAKWLIHNKIMSQYVELYSRRDKDNYIKEAMNQLLSCDEKAKCSDNINSLMAYEGIASKVYFSQEFNNTAWNGRQPRLKRDIINSTLDIGYTILFSFVEALLASFGFDLYCGFLHKQFYLRKSLVCDFVEPFRPLIDHAVRKGINLKQISIDDFTMINGEYRLKWKKSPEYVSFLIKPIIENKDDIFLFIQKFYRSFMKEIDISCYPNFYLGTDNDNNKL